MRSSRSFLRSVVVGLAASALVACGTRTQLGDGEGDSVSISSDDESSDGAWSGAGARNGDYRPLDGDEDILIGGDGPPDEASDFDFSRIEDEALRDRYEECAGYCEVVMVPRCPERPLAENFVECLRSCAARRDSCASAVMSAFRCVAESAGEVIACDVDGDAVLVCGPCDRELGRVARRCDEGEIECRFL